MSAIKFHHVYGALLILSALCAFVIPASYTARVQPQLQSLFYPVAAPVRGVAGWVNDRIIRDKPKDARDVHAIAQENEFLRQQLTALMTEVDDLRDIDAQRRKLGDIRERCTPVAVIGADAAGRDGLLLRGSSFEGIRQGQFVLYPGGVVGRIDHPPGIAGAQVRLITDRGMRIEARFGRWESDPAAEGGVTFRRLPLPTSVIEGVGDGAMQCATSLTLEEVTKASLRQGDWVFVEDPEWYDLHGRLLGKVARVAPRSNAPLYTEIRVEPTAPLLRLREVMVLTK